MTIFIVCGNPDDPEDRDRTVSTEDNIVRVCEQQVPIYCIRAETWNECMTTFNRIEGLEEYKPFPENEWTPTAPQAPARTTPNRRRLSRRRGRSA